MIDLKELLSLMKLLASADLIIVDVAKQRIAVDPKVFLDVVTLLPKEQQE